MKAIFVKKAAFALVIFTLATVYSSSVQAAAGDLYVGALNKNKIYIFNTSGLQTAQSPFESIFFAVSAGIPDDLAKQAKDAIVELDKAADQKR
jgi:hypothetical protein